MVPSVLPDGLPAPDDGALPAWVAGSPDAGRGVGVYLHVPFCTVRCGYCDFNTYTASQLGGGASQVSYADTLLTEVELARRVFADAGRGGRPVRTVFVGGGTPTVLPPGDLARMLDAVRGAWGLAPEAEITTETNPDSVTPDSLVALARGGITRVSLGMQSTVPHVLATLERTHDPSRVPEVVRWARDAGLDTSLDLIYGTPGESLDDWRRSVEAALDCGVDHVSAYALVIEPGTRMAAAVRRGGHPRPRLDHQGVGGDVADPAVQRDLDGPPPVVERLPRCAVDQVEGRVEPGVARPPQHLGHPGRVVGPLEGGQHVRHRRLHAERDPGEPAARERHQ